MEVVIGLIGILIKIAILSSIYAFLTLGIFKLIGRVIPNSWFDRVSIKKLRLWMISGSFFFIVLFCFFCTYWGFHGLGDGPRIPIGHEIIVDNIDWRDYGYIDAIETSDSMEIEMTKFKVVNDNLVGNLHSEFYDYKNSYFVLDLVKKELTEFKTLKDYEDFALKNKLPLSNELNTFRQNYWDYWGGLRFWLLP